MMSDVLAVRVAKEIAAAMLPLVGSYRELSRLSAVTKDKGDGHLAHRLDELAEQAFFAALGHAGYAGQVFSEESGLSSLGPEPRLVVCDPYCNTSLTFRGVRESAVAVYEYALTGEFIGGAIADLQVSRIVCAGDRGTAQILELAGAGQARSARTSATDKVDQAFLVVSLLKHKRRANIPFALLSETAMLTTIDGAIVAARLAMGDVDGFVDSVIGQPSYEALAYELVRRAGGVVTDRLGEPLRFDDIVSHLAVGRVRRHTIVAAGNQALHSNIMAMLDES